MRLGTYTAAVLLILAVLVLCTGCEHKAVRIERDGFVGRYDRWSFFGDSTTEGVSIARVGADFTFDLGKTGSDADTEAFAQLIQGLVLELAKRGAGLPVQ